MTARPINVEWLPKAKIVQQLQNGNYEVTPEFLLWTFRLKEALAECQHRIKVNGDGAGAFGYGVVK